MIEREEFIFHKGDLVPRWVMYEENDNAVIRFGVRVKILKYMRVVWVFPLNGSILDGQYLCHVDPIDKEKRLKLHGAPTNWRTESMEVTFEKFIENHINPFVADSLQNVLCCDFLKQILTT